MTFYKDPDLGKYAREQDVLENHWTMERAGDEVVVDYSVRFAFGIDRAVSDTWKYLKDLNLWTEDQRYSGVVGDAAEGSTLCMTIAESFHDHYMESYGMDSRTYKKFLNVKRVVPEQLIVLEELSADRKTIFAYYLWALSEHQGRTTVTGVFAFEPTRAPAENEQQFREFYQSASKDVEDRWKLTYIPRLRQLVESD